jgi:hypothetical protein
MVIALAHERLRPPVRLRDPFICAQARFAVAGFDLSILPNVDSDQRSGPTDTEAFTLPVSLKHRGERRQRSHGRSLR